MFKDTLHKKCIHLRPFKKVQIFCKLLVGNFLFRYVPLLISGLVECIYTHSHTFRHTYFPPHPPPQHIHKHTQTCLGVDCGRGSSFTFVGAGLDSSANLDAARTAAAPIERVIYIFLFNFVFFGRWVVRGLQ